jgi:hypothetical protein
VAVIKILKGLQEKDIGTALLNCNLKSAVDARLYLEEK